MYNYHIIFITIRKTVFHNVENNFIWNTETFLYSDYPTITFTHTTAPPRPVQLGCTCFPINI